MKKNSYVLFSSGQLEWNRWKNKHSYRTQRNPPRHAAFLLFYYEMAFFSGHNQWYIALYEHAPPPPPPNPRYATVSFCFLLLYLCAANLSMRMTACSKREREIKRKKKWRIQRGAQQARALFKFWPTMFFIQFCIRMLQNKPQVV